MKELALRLLLSYVALLSIRGARAGEIPRDEYLKHLPLGSPRLVQETAASAALQLYGDRGDPSYRDTSPVDGIDDERHAVLMSLAVRFAPFLVQNTADIPVNFDVYIDNRESFPLYLDTWDVTGIDPILVESKGLNFSALGQGECNESPSGQPLAAHPQPTSDGATEDCKLLDLLDHLAPGGTAKTKVEASFVKERPEIMNVLFYDFPGDGAGSWAQGYEPEYEKTPEEKRKAFPHAYVHPFLIEIADGPAAGYELVLQYWFFYPSNDSGMDHEGDWEHMNVIVSPKSMVEQSLSVETIEKILTGVLSTPDTTDPLVIKRVDYYFHHLVMSLDFSDPNVYRPRKEWQRDVEDRHQTRFREDHVWKAIRHLAYVDDEETTVNTHPFAYIGSDNKGLNQAMAAPGGRNRDAHGSYPFPGRYQNVGPGGSTDRISLDLDPRHYWKRLAAGRVSVGPVFRRGSVLSLADPDRLRIVPDWERVVNLTRENARARREWSWLLLPIHWGYPATQSPFSGVLEHYNTGNVAPAGPSFNSGWNVSGASAGFSQYEPHTIPSVFPLQLQDNFRNDLGFLNLTLPTLFNLPPLDFATRIAAYPFKRAFGRRDPVYYPKEGVPFRFVGLSSGISIQVFHDDFNALALSPNQFDQFIDRFLGHYVGSGADSTTTVAGGRDINTNSVGPFFQLSFYIGGRFTSENTVRNARSTFGTSIEFSNIPSFDYRAEINYWEYAGSIRYSLSTSRVQPFVKAGYGWSWYRVENVRANGEPFDPAESDWIKPRSIWPNVWHYGLGIEFIPFKHVGKLPRGAELAFRLEYGRYHESLGLDLSQFSLSSLARVFNTLGDVPNGETVTRNDFLFGTTVSF